MNELLRHHKTRLHRRTLKLLTRLRTIHHSARVKGILQPILIVLLEKMLAKKCVVNGILRLSLPTGGGTNHTVQSRGAQAVHGQEIVEIDNPHLLSVLTRIILTNFRQVRQREGSVTRRRSSCDLDFLKNI